MRDVIGDLVARALIGAACLGAMAGFAELMKAAYLYSCYIHGGA